MMSFELERAFGRILGLDYSQVNPGALTNGETDGTLGWPVMQPMSGACGATGGACIPNPTVLRYDDIAALNRIYPITAANLASFPGKQLTAANTISIQGTVSFRTGYGMQGVNVVARPLDANGNPLYQYTVTAVTGALFSGNHGNPVTGWTDANGNPLTMWGSNDPSLQGSFDLSGIPLPPGVTTANYQVTFEAINPLYILADSVGPYVAGPGRRPRARSTPSPCPISPRAARKPSTSPPPTRPRAASTTPSAPRPSRAPCRTGGLWCGRLSQVGQSDWFTFPVRGNRIFTVVTQALDETGAPSELQGHALHRRLGRIRSRRLHRRRRGARAQRPGHRRNLAARRHQRRRHCAHRHRRPARRRPPRLRLQRLGPLRRHGLARAPSRLRRPHHHSGHGLSPCRHGSGRRPAGARHQHLAQPDHRHRPSRRRRSGVISGSVDVEVDDLPTFYAAAVIPGGVSYDSGTGDALTLVTAPTNTVPIGVPLPFTVTALGSNLAPAGGVTVIYTVTSGTATLGCGLPVCSVTATGDGRATMNVTAVNGTWSIVTASLTNGSSLQAQFAGGTPPSLAVLTPQLSLAAGATFTWTVQALVLSNGVPVASQSVAWQTVPGSGITAQGSAAALTNSSGIATKTLTVGPLAEGQTGQHQCLPQRHQPVRRLHRLRRAP